VNLAIGLQQKWKHSLDPSLIPLKTAAGSEEIRTRALKLESRMRALLILIDGRKAVLTLQETAGEATINNLRRLRELGLVTWDDSLSGQLGRHN
jgi:hypothetical protein